MHFCCCAYRKIIIVYVISLNSSCLGKVERTQHLCIRGVLYMYIHMYICIIYILKKDVVEYV